MVFIFLKNKALSYNLYLEIAPGEINNVKIHVFVIFSS